MCIIDCLSTIVFILPLYLDDTKVIILILWRRTFQLEYWRTFQLVSTHNTGTKIGKIRIDLILAVIMMNNEAILTTHVGWLQHMAESFKIQEIKGKSTDNINYATCTLDTFWLIYHMC